VRESHLRYTPWDKGLHLYREIDGAWHETAWDHDIPLVNVARRCRGGSAMPTFVSAIPDEIRELISPFEYNQTHMLQWAARDSRMRDLLVSNSVLYWLFVHKILTNECSLKQADTLINAKQYEILYELAGSGGKPALRFLRKLQLAKGDRSECDLIYWVLKQPKVLLKSRHIQSIPVQNIYVVRSLPEGARSARAELMMRSIPFSYSFSQAMELGERLTHDWIDTERLGRALGVINIPAAMGQCQSQAKLIRLHNQWASRFNKLKREVSVGGYDKFPQPPLEGNGSIVPICSLEELYQEGREMRHCVGSYADQVWQGRSFFYRVLKPERATLEVKITDSGPVFRELLLKRNGQPDDSTVANVKRWLSGNNSPPFNSRQVRPSQFIHFSSRLKTRPYRGGNLAANFRFSNFIVCKSNQEAVDIAKQAANSTVYSPLLIYGGNGLGKTHLIHAVGQQFLEDRTGVMARYRHAEHFVSEFGGGSQRHVEQLRHVYESTDILLIDDIQFLCGKPVPQQMLIHLIEMAMQSGHQMVLTCDPYVDYIDGLDERLKSLIRRWTTVELKLSDQQVCEAILAAKAEQRGLTLPVGICALIASQPHTDVRSLEGLLCRVIATAYYSRRELSLGLAREVIGRAVTA